MDIIRSVDGMQRRALATKVSGVRIGFVPTMGFLHAGHMALIRCARDLADQVVVSIFVNPTQFLPGEDFASYPRDIDRDRGMCESAGVDILFCPTPEEMYAPDRSVWVEETMLSRGLCGEKRPGHFKGVTTVVAKLFNIVQPHVAVFGQKDAQQAKVIGRLVRDLNFPVEIVVAPTVREQDGLAMSSRNARLTPRQRQDALCLYRALGVARGMVEQGVRDAAIIRAAMADTVLAVDGAEIEYAEILDDATLQPVPIIAGRVLVALAVRVGKTRLIDNVSLTP
jgi:pantoate--beta-alanine ligase